MKIAVVRKKYNPYGGAERYLHLLLQEWIKKGHEVHVYAHQWPAAEADGLIFHPVPMIGILSLFKIWSFALASWWMLRRFDGDLIFSNERIFIQDVFRCSDGIHRSWLRVRMKHLPWFKRLSIRLNPLHWSVCFLDWYIFTRHAYQKIIAPSEFIKREILDNFPAIRDADIRVIYNGVDLERYHPENKKKYRASFRQEMGYGDKDSVLLFVGTGYERKGLRYLIESMALLPGNVRLLVIGKGRILPYRRIAERQGVRSRIHFLGPVNGTEPYYAISDVLVLPTLYEPMANVVLEALASGIPVVTSRGCGNSEVISPARDGEIIENPKNPRELAEKIQIALMLARKAETETWARRKAESFTLQKAVTEVSALLTEAKRAASPPRRMK